MVIERRELDGEVLWGDVDGCLPGSVSLHLKKGKAYEGDAPLKVRDPFARMPKEDMGVARMAVFRFLEETNTPRQSKAN